MLHGHSFLVSIKTEGIYEEIAKDLEARFDTSNFVLNRRLPNKKKKKKKKERKSYWINQK